VFPSSPGDYRAFAIAPSNADALDPLVRWASAYKQAGQLSDYAHLSFIGVQPRTVTNQGLMIFSAIKEQKLISGEKVMKFPYVGVSGDELCFVRYRDEDGQDCEAFCERYTIFDI
jgi:hypothetical protein